MIPEWESRTEALLLGRTTYDIWKHAWGVWPEDAPGMMGEFTRRYNRVPEYVVAHSDPGLTEARGLGSGRIVSAYRRAPGADTG